MRRENRFYMFISSLFSFLLFFVYRIKGTGLENIPEGGAVLCGQHSSLLDPILLGLAVGRKDVMHMMAKKELEKIPLIGWAIRRAGSFFVDRDKPDLMAIKTAISLLKKGEKVVIFPEGTRSAEDNAVAVKAGAVRIAEKAGVPVVPVYIPRKKPLWHTIRIVIGEPYYINPEKARLKTEDYYPIANELMDRIYALNSGGEN